MSYYNQYRDMWINPDWRPERVAVGNVQVPNGIAATQVQPPVDLGNGQYSNEPPVGSTPAMPGPDYGIPTAGPQEIPMPQQPETGFRLINPGHSVDGPVQNDVPMPKADVAAINPRPLDSWFPQSQYVPGGDRAVPVVEQTREDLVLGNNQSTGAVATPQNIVANYGTGSPGDNGITSNGGAPDAPMAMPGTIQAVGDNVQAVTNTKQVGAAPGTIKGPEVMMLSQGGEVPTGGKYQAAYERACSRLFKI